MSAELDEQQNASVGMTVGMIEVGILFSLIVDADSADGRRLPLSRVSVVFLLATKHSQWTASIYYHLSI
jgi:hypothetical protein